MVGKVLRADRTKNFELAILETCKNTQKLVLPWGTKVHQISENLEKFKKKNFLRISCWNKSKIYILVVLTSKRQSKRSKLFKNASWNYTKNIKF